MINLKDKVIDVSCGMGSCNSALIVGEDKVALIDGGMVYCAEELIGNIKGVLGHDKALDYVLISHSHYDHIGAIPYLRQTWPNVKVLGAKHAQHILTRENALKTIKELGNKAARYYNIDEIIDYDDNLMRVDKAILDQEIIDLGGIDIKVLETPGHTKCCLSFLIGDDILFASESSGTLKSSGKINPTIVVSYEKAMESIEKCRNTQATYVISPHTGFINDSPEDYWEKCITAATESTDFVRNLYKRGYTEGQIFNEYKKVYFDEEIRLHQPESAFDMNTKAMIGAVLK